MDPATWAVVEQQRAWLDAHADAQTSADAGSPSDASAAGAAGQTHLRILKLSEEVGEAAAALIGATGANPRKGRTHEMSDVADELADVAISALVALATVTGDAGAAREALAARLGHVYTRSLDHGAPPLPQATYNPDRRAWLASLPRVLAATVVLFTDENDRVLLVEQGYRKPPTNWALAGGGLDADEPPRVGARREVLEEIALNIDLGRLLAVNWHPATDRPPLVVYVFDGGVLTAAQIKRIRLLDGELTRYGFFTLEEAKPLLHESSYREIKAALAVRDGRAECTDLQQGRRG